MIEIRITDVCGPICVAVEDGDKLCNQVHAALDRAEKVCLDFSGVTALAGAFLNTAVGGLYAFFGKDDLAQRLLCKGLDPTDEAVLRLVQRNAIRFYSATPLQQQALLASSNRAAGA